jgi:hypothetical protein
MIELERGAYKLSNITSYVFVPRKWWSGPPFIACRGGGSSSIPL